MKNCLRPSQESLVRQQCQMVYNDYNYLNGPAVKTSLEKFPLKQMIFNWNSLDIDLKATGDLLEFQRMLNARLLSQYKYETDCPINCFSCNQD